MTAPIFALIDCNNFFVSCLRVFRPDLEGKPVVALSSNDGCVVARSNEAKMLGVPMGAPAFKWRQFFTTHGVIQFSGNFELYGDMSRRITSILTTITPHIEIYSVDESFLDLSQLPINNFTEWGKEVRDRVLKWTGIPISIGIAPSKTLAKLAADRAKKVSELNGVLDLSSLSQNERLPWLRQIPIQDVWGVGRRLAPKLRTEFIHTAADLCNVEQRLARQLMGIHGIQMVMELGGTSCLPLETHSSKPKNISVSRTFGHDTNSKHEVESALASFIFKASYKLRLSRQLAGSVGFFMTTNRHKPGYQVISSESRLARPTCDTGELTSRVISMMKTLFRHNASYHRAGIWLSSLTPVETLQLDILGNVNVANYSSTQRRMLALDTINEKYPKHTLHYASEDLGDSWHPKNQIKLPRFTTRWEELPVINAH